MFALYVHSVIFMADYSCIGVSTLEAWQGKKRFFLVAREECDKKNIDSCNFFFRSKKFSIFSSSSSLLFFGWFQKINLGSSRMPDCQMTNTSQIPPLSCIRGALKQTEMICITGVAWSRIRVDHLTSCSYKCNPFLTGFIPAIYSTQLVSTHKPISINSLPVCIAPHNSSLAL